MQVFSALGYTIPEVQYLAFVPAVGNSVVQAQITIDNQGVPEMNLEIPGRPLYLEIDGIPQLLYKDEKSNLKIPLSLGSQTLTVQYQTEPFLKFFNVAEKIPLLTFPSPVTTASTALRIHRKWIPFGATFSRYFYFPLGFWGFALQLILCIGFYLFLRRFGIRALKSALFAGLFLLLSMWSILWVLVPAAFMAATGFYRIRGKDQPSKWVKALLFVFLFLILCGLVIFAVIKVTISGTQRAPEDLLSGSQISAGENRVAAPPKEAEKNVGPQSYEGMPAKIDIPSEERADIHFKETMAASGKQLVLRYVVVPAVLLRLVLSIAVVILLLLIWKERGRLGSILKEAYLKGRAEPQPK
jgi:hypothetical protein